MIDVFCRVKMSSDNKLLLSTIDAAILYGCTPETVRRWCRLSLVVYQMISRRYLIEVDQDQLTNIHIQRIKNNPILLEKFPIFQYINPNRLTLTVMDGRRTIRSLQRQIPGLYHEIRTSIRHRVIQINRPFMVNCNGMMIQLRVTLCRDGFQDYEEGDMVYHMGDIVIQDLSGGAIGSESEPCGTSSSKSSSSLGVRRKKVSSSVVVKKNESLELSKPL